MAVLLSITAILSPAQPLSLESSNTQRRWNATSKAKEASTAWARDCWKAKAAKPPKFAGIGQSRRSAKSWKKTPPPIKRSTWLYSLYKDIIPRLYSFGLPMKYIFWMRDAFPCSGEGSCTYRRISFSKASAQPGPLRACAVAREVCWNPQSMACSPPLVLCWIKALVESGEIGPR